MIKDNTGKWCSKKLLSIVYGIAAIITAFIPEISDSVTITFSLISTGHSTLVSDIIKKTAL